MTFCLQSEVFSWHTEKDSVYRWHSVALAYTYLNYVLVLTGCLPVFVPPCSLHHFSFSYTVDLLRRGVAGSLHGKYVRE